MTRSIPKTYHSDCDLLVVHCHPKRVGKRSHPESLSAVEAEFTNTTRSLETDIVWAWVILRSPDDTARRIAFVRITAEAWEGALLLGMDIVLA